MGATSKLQSAILTNTPLKHKQQKRKDKTMTRTIDPAPECSVHAQPIIYTDAGYFSHQLKTLHRYDPDDTEDGGWCAECKTEIEEESKAMDGCMSFLPIADAEEDEWEDGTDLIMVPIGGIADIIVCKCGQARKRRR